MKERPLLGIAALIALDVAMLPLMVFSAAFNPEDARSAYAENFREIGRMWREWRTT